MSKFDIDYKEIVKSILLTGFQKEDRTGVGTISMPGAMIRHDMSIGFPLTNLRKMPFKAAAVELEGFIKGITSKKWYKERGCNFWNQWCAPYQVPYGHDAETKKKMEDCDDLGPIYGFQMRKFGSWSLMARMHEDLPNSLGYSGKRVDQLKYVVDELKKNPNSRRMLVSYWNPLCNDLMALNPCHFAWQVTVTDGRLNLFYYMRSVDFILGNNCSSYALLLKLLALEAGLQEGYLVGFFADTHIYTNQIEGAKELISRNADIMPLPTVEIKNFKSIYEFDASTVEVKNYNPLPPIKFPIAV